MKKSLNLLSLIFVLCSLKFNAQIFRGITLTGFTQDVIAENNPAANSTGIALDASGYVLYTALYTGTTTLGGLPNNGVCTTPTRTYSLAPSAGKNAVRIAFNGTDSLTLTNPASYSVLSILGFSTGSDALTDVTVRFTDGTSVVYNSRTLYNWSSSQPAILAGFGKTNRTTNSIYFTATEPKMYSLDIPIACANQGKLISKVLVKNRSTGAVVYLFAGAGVGKSSFVSNSTPATCSGSSTGIAKALGVDAYGPLSYTWMPGGQTTQTATNLAAGNYTLTVLDGNGCTYTSTVAVTQPTLSFSIISISSTSLACGSVADGTAQVSVAGGNQPYTYTWDNTTPVTSTVTTNTISALAAGTHSITIKDNNGCVLNSTIAVNKPNVVIAISTTSLLCGTTANGSATVTSVTGATGPFTYTWTPAAQTGSVATGLGAGTQTLSLSYNSGCVLTETVAITAPALTLNVANTTCTLAAGSATVASVTGGAGAPYTYTWVPAGGNAATASNLSAGNYTVNVRDNANCLVSKTFTIASLNPTLTVATSSLLCGNQATGSATVTSVTGATGPYTYTWMPSSQTGSVATSLGAGIYTVTVKAPGGCISTETVSIDAPSISVATTSTSCKSTQQSTGSATVIAINGGTAPYSYSWDSGTMSNIANTPVVNGLAEGSYVVNVTDANNCIFSQPLAIAGPTTAALTSVTSASAATCSGINDGKARVSAAGGLLPYAYFWNTNPPQYTATVTGLPSPNTFISTVIDFNGCLSSKPVIIYPAPAQLTLYASPSNTICPGTSAVLSITGLSGTGTYTWSTGANTTSVTVSPTATLTTYSVTGVATSSCIVTGSISVFTSTNAATNCPTSIKEQNNVSYNLYPNPTNGEFTIVFEQMQNNATIEVMDALGKLVMSQQITGVEATVNSSSLQNGIYFVTVRDEQKILVRTKVIKQ